jgi:lysozyme
LNQNDRAGAADEFSKWIYAGGQRSDGLIDRRRQEQILFKEEIWRFKKELGIAHY